ncbi:alanine racemase [Aureimonas endophytica]|uniref:Alanine racemase n=1 Tax=Aureimonas endophytica TaxID=2027858 RepID=A0A917E3H2_9HYPH|nr:alanine racemase [Aureimonas endophytica]GGD97848.1 alanine racemase [Aureimonas endophytica]
MGAHSANLSWTEGWRTATVPDRGEIPGGGVLTIDLGALAANYRQLVALAGGAKVAGVVKADGYGLGAVPVARRLAREGCESFFVAHLAEGLALREALPEAEILVLNGLAPGAEPACAEAGLVPVLNSLAQIEAFAREGVRRGRRLPAAIQVDSGMSRLGLSPAEVERIATDPTRLFGLETVLVMSHLACADTPDHPANAAQLAAFRRLAALLPAARRSLANSAGLFLGPDFRFDLARPGIAVYGGRPFADPAPNPMRPVVRLQGRVIQLRDVPAGAGIGYGHTVTAERPMRLATLGLGYADGWPRRLGNHIAAHIGETALPMVGRVSMDSIILDAGAAELRPGDLVDLIGPAQSLDAVAEAAETISYEILTGLGSRFERHYLEDEAGVSA